LKYFYSASLPGDAARRQLEHDDFSSNRHRALSFRLSMIPRVHPRRRAFRKAGTRPRIKSEGMLFRIMFLTQ
jgi:hypothetical protein